jgi:hypothetical protein
VALPGDDVRAFLAIALAVVSGLPSCGPKSTGDAFGSGPQGPGDDAAAEDAGADDASGAPTEAGVDAGAHVVFHVGDASSDGAADNGDCPASAKLVYVTGEGGQLWSFYPPTMKFTLIGTMSCLPAVPSHMTVDRTGTAWVESNGDLYRASTTDASCTAVSNWSPENLYSSFALSFLGTSAATDTTLYMLTSTLGAGSGLGGGLLGSFDTTTGAVTTVGNVDISNAAGDMTTNGDGTLYFLLDSEPLTLYEIQPTTGAIANTYTVDAPGGGDQALAFWGGSFYAFESGDIYTFDTGTKATMDLGAAPLSVTGAGQSTCVPMVAPPAQ